MGRPRSNPDEPRAKYAGSVYAISTIDKIREAQKLRGRKRHADFRDWIEREYTGKPCQDCEQVFPFICMDFDHRENKIKKFGISQGGSKSLKAVREEVAKCDLVCSNCHRKRTYKRGIHANVGKGQPRRKIDLI